jgi:hypothetical protein
MHHRGATTTITALTLGLGLAACSSSGTADSSSKTSTKPSATPSTTAPVVAGDVFAAISAKVPEAKLTGTVTAQNDPNHLLGRPNQYTSKVIFSDARIAAADVSGLEKGDALRGGAVEVFARNADAKARADYIQEVTRSLPALAEYDFVHGTVVVRVSHYLTPKQAAEYDLAAATLG